MHVWGILAHLGLVVAASIGFLCDVGQTTQTTGPWGYSAAAQVHPCRYALMAGGGFHVEDRLSYDMATRPLLMTSVMVVSPLWNLFGNINIRNAYHLAQGALGLALNTALFILLLKVEPNRIMLTEGEQHWRKQVVTLFGCLLNLLLGGAGFALAIALGIKAADSKTLIAPLIWASIQAYVYFPPLAQVLAWPTC